jgi:hypothetical protein
MRSRAVSLPFLCCESIRACPPPMRALSRFCSSFSRISFIGMVEHRSPGRGFARHQPVRRIGAIADEIGAGIFHHLVDHLVAHRSHPVEADIGNTGGVHLGRVDVRALPAPFGGDQLSRGKVGQPQQVLARRAGLAPVQQHEKTALARLHRHVFIKAFGQRPRLRGAGPGHGVVTALPHVAFRIKNVAHHAPE